jgi:hypothetical protein
LRINNIEFIFCGGCKSLYDRETVFKLLINELEHCEIKMLIIMNGCFRGCERNYSGEYDKVINIEKYLDLVNKNNNDPVLIVSKILKDINEQK